MTPSKRTVVGVILSISACHMIKDMLQSLIAASYPTLKADFHLSFTQIGLVTLAYQLTGSLLQPVVGLLADRRPAPFSLPIGTLFTFGALLALSFAETYEGLFLGACILGIGSAVFHPESSRVARMAAGDRPGFAQSLFQVGGNAGGALGPIGAAVVVARFGQRGLGYFSGLALVSTFVLTQVGLWYKREGLARLAEARSERVGRKTAAVSRGRVTGALAVLLVLTFSKFVYLASLTSYFTFYLMHKFDVSVQSAQMHLFATYAGVAAGTLAGGPLGDRFGRKHIIWFSILGVLPFTLLLPHASLFWTGVLTVVIGFVLASAFPAIVVYAQEIVPDRVGLVAGLFFGLSFGAAGIGAALLGALADSSGIDRVYGVCAYLPAIGMLAAFLPDLARSNRESHGRAVEAPERASA
ncbi:MAG TPA: MFS transporter [Polyangiaceae bacterium]|jgi:FSR family fosmidomycin resistance protein-like MFS transporter